VDLGPGVLSVRLVATVTAGQQATSRTLPAIAASRTPPWLPSGGDVGVGVGVFPECEEVFVGGERTDAGGIGIRSLRGSRLQGIGSGVFCNERLSCNFAAVELPDSRLRWL